MPTRACASATASRAPEAGGVRSISAACSSVPTSRFSPGFITQPIPVITGQSSAPSTVELYVNDALRQTSQVPTGPFTIENRAAIDRNRPGASRGSRCARPRDRAGARFLQQRGPAARGLERLGSAARRGATQPRPRERELRRGVRLGALPAGPDQQSHRRRPGRGIARDARRGRRLECRRACNLALLQGGLAASHSNEIGSGTL